MTSDKAYATEQRLNVVVATMLPQAFVKASSQTFNTTSDFLLGAFVTPSMPAGSYVIQLALQYVANQTGGTPAFAFHAASTSLASVLGLVTTGTALSVVGNPSGLSWNSVGMNNGVFYNLAATASITTTAAGNISFQAHTSVAADTFVVAAGAAMIVTPALAA
jgi:hypothetical protein